MPESKSPRVKPDTWGTQLRRASRLILSVILRVYSHHDLVGEFQSASGPPARLSSFPRSTGRLRWFHWSAKPMYQVGCPPQLQSHSGSDKRSARMTRSQINFRSTGLFVVAMSDRTVISALSAKYGERKEITNPRLPTYFNTEGVGAIMGWRFLSVNEMPKT
jgi:hypothetical protein